jgi:hypothetical protein
MQVEVIAAEGGNGGTLLLWGTDQEGLDSLVSAVCQLADGTHRQVGLAPRSGITGVSVLGVAGRVDAGLRSIAPGRYELALSPTEWDTIAGLIESFCHDRTGFHFLSENATWTVKLAPTRTYY